MYGRRLIGLAFVALLVIVVISTLGGAARQNAWMQGYMAGQLAAGSDGGAALAPYMVPGSPFTPGYGGGGISVGLFVGLGFLALGFAFLARGRGHRHWQMRKEEWERRMHEEAQRWHQQAGRPWEPDADANEGSRTV
jgi:hypothetical protein